MNSYLIKAKRTFGAVRRFGWIFTLTVAFGGLWYPRLGLLVFGVIFSLAIMSLFKGRYWCGNYCAHGSLFDQMLLPFSRNSQLPRVLKSKLLRAAVFSWFMYNLTSKFVRVAALWGDWMFWDRLGFVFVASYLMVTIAGGVLGLFVTPRSWCQFCPMGSMQLGMYRLGKRLGWTRGYDQMITVEDLGKCHKCAKCARVCPMQLAPYSEFTQNNQFTHEECIRCLTCVENCPARVLTLSTAGEAQQIREANDNRGYEHRRKFSATITHVSEPAADTREYTFVHAGEESVSPLPGQFVLVKIQAQPEIFRAYSISGIGPGNQLRVAVKRIPGGYGTGIIFDTFATGMSVELEGPMGHELLVDESAENVLLIAGGIGITPFVPILQDIKARGRRATLVYGANTENDLAYDATIRSLASGYSGISYLPVLARPQSDYAGHKGLVTDVISGLDIGDAKVYMCGPQGMVKAVTSLLNKKGVPADRIFAETA